jgi:hypothetical protein
VLVTENDVMSIDVITSVFEKSMGTSTGVESNLLDEAWDKIPVPGTKIDVFWIGHELVSRGDGRIDNSGAINFWEDNLDVVPADEIAAAFNTEFKLGGVGSLLALGFEKSPWEWDSRSAGHVEWAPPHVINLLGINAAESNSFWELTWDLRLGEGRDSRNKSNWIVNEGGESIDCLVSNSLDVGDD